MITVLSLLRGLLLTTFHLKYGKSLLSNIPLRKGDYASYALRSTTIPLDLEVMQQAVYQAPTAKDSSVVIIGGGPAGLAAAAAALMTAIFFEVFLRASAKRISHSFSSAARGFTIHVACLPSKI